MYLYTVDILKKFLKCIFFFFRDQLLAGELDTRQSIIGTVIRYIFSKYANT
jgi:hypothetical protein